MGDNAMLASPTVLFSSGYEAVKPTFEFGANPNPDGKGEVLIFRDIPVFRSGTFRSSTGEQNTWDSFHLQQMKSNFELLQERNIFTRGPVRKGHGSFLTDPMTNLVGWMTSVRLQDAVAKHDNETYTYYLASGYIFDAEAMQNVSEGHWSNRSAEVGPYETNNETPFWPLLYGFAFVDIPAVEGLDAFGRSITSAGKRLIADDPKEFSMSGTTTPPAVPPAPPAVPQPPQVDPATPPAAPATPPVQEAQNHGAPVPQMSAFRVNGVETRDYASVQAHIETLELFQRESIESGRAGFIDSLVAGNQILAPQADAFKKLVNAPGYTGEMFEMFKAGFENAPPAQVLAQHGQSSGVNGVPAGESPEAEEIRTLEGLVQMHRNSGMSEADLQKVGSFQRLQALKAAAN